MANGGPRSGVSGLAELLKGLRASEYGAIPSIPGLTTDSQNGSSLKASSDNNDRSPSADAKSNSGDKDHEPNPALATSASGPMGHHDPVGLGSHPPTPRNLPGTGRASLFGTPATPSMYGSGLLNLSDASIRERLSQTGRGHAVSLETTLNFILPNTTDRLKEALRALSSEQLFVLDATLSNVISEETKKLEITSEAKAAPSKPKPSF